jgi:hypothetical protein
MASALEGERFTIGAEVPLEELFTVDYTELYMTDTGAGDPAMESGLITGIGSAQSFAMTTFPVFEDSVAPQLPGSADPPFPPTYPYFFSTAQIYGRENMNNVLRCVRGDNFSFTGVVEVADAPLNLTGATITMTAKWNLMDSSNVFQLSVGNGITISDAAAGEITVLFPTSATSSLPPTEVTLKYDVQVITAAAKTYTVARGDLVVVPDATV